MFRAAFVCIILFFFFNFAHAQERVALVIGNGAYQSAGHLPNPPNDAADVSVALKSVGFEVIQGTNTTKREMEDLIRSFSSKLEKAKLALFYYSGHGLQVNGHNYLIPVDATLDKTGDLSLNAIDIQVVLEQTEAKNRASLIFLDACRDNPFTRSLAASAMTSARSVTIARGLAEIKTAAGTMIAFATQPDNVALDGQGRNSPFTAAFLKHLTTPDTDIAIVMRAIRTDVIGATLERQVPWDHSSLTDSVILVPRGGSSQVATASIRPPSPPPPAQVWELSNAEAHTIFQKTSVYGKYFPNIQAWRYAKGNQTYLIKTVTGKKVVSNRGTKYYVAVKGEMEGSQCHACTGLLGLFVFEDRQGTPILVSSLPVIEAGSWGTTSGITFDVLQLGSEYYFGWILKSGYGNQGYFPSYYFFFLPRGNGIELSGVLPHEDDNTESGTCPSSPNQQTCHNFRFELRVDNSDASAKVFPIVLQRTGTEAGRSAAPENFQISFDTNRWRYNLPTRITKLVNDIRGP